MKHPALTRVLAIALVVLCLTMAAAGTLGLRQAQRERRLCQEDMERLRGRLEEYTAVCASLEGGESGEMLNARLDERREAYEKGSSEHRAELSTFTATQYGLATGLEAIDEAEAQFASLKQLFKRNLVKIEAGVAEIDTAVENLQTLYDTAAPILESAHTHLDNARAIANTLESGEELTCAQLAGACDELLSIADESDAAAESLRALEPTIDALANVDLVAIEDMLTAMQELARILSAFGDIPLDGYQDFDVDFDFDMEQLVQMKTAFDQAWASVKQLLALYDESSGEADSILRQLTGMDSAELRVQIAALRDDLAARGDEPLDPAEAIAVRAAWLRVRDPVLQGLDTMETELRELDASVTTLHDTLVTLQAQMAMLKTLLAKADGMIAAAEEAMFQARALIWQQMGKQREKEEELWDRKDALEQDALALEQLAGEAETREEREQRQRTLSMNLLSRDGIKERHDAGEELGAAAQAYLDDTLRGAEESYACRRAACLLMIFGALYSLLGIPAAFESVRSRLMLTLPALHCLGCAAGAVQILWKLGRGLSYSCLAVMLFAVLLLLVSRPKKKARKRRSA